MRAHELQACKAMTVAEWIAGRCRGGARLGCVRARSATLLATAVAVLLVWPLAASAALPADGSSVDAPGLTGGPFITSAGLAWESSGGVMLTNLADRSSVLAAQDAPNWENLTDLAWFGQEWWVLARPSGVFAGRIGGSLRELPLRGKCNPGSASLVPRIATVQYAVSGSHLYAALPSGCLAHRAAPFGEVVDIDLRSLRRHVVTPVPGRLEYMAASGKYLALAYSRVPDRSGTESRLFVRVLDAATGALVNQIAPPPNPGGGRRNSASGIQVDDHGDVLVNAGCCGGAPGQLAHAAQPAEIERWWWARAGSTVGHETELGNDAVLSDGRVAFMSVEGEGPESTTIDVRNLFAGTTRTAVIFAGSVAADGLALRGNGLAWAQQSTVLNVLRAPTEGGGSFEECKKVPLSPPELVRLDLRGAPSPPVVITGVPIPPQYAHGPVCIEA
jgi:hypothetical protein